MRILIFGCDDSRPWLERRTRMRIAKLAKDRSRACPEVRRLDEGTPKGIVWLLRAGSSPLDLPGPLPSPLGKALLAFGPEESFEPPCRSSEEHALFRYSSDLRPFFAKVDESEAAAAIRTVSSLYTNCAEELLEHGLGGLSSKLKPWGRSHAVRMFVHPGFAVRQCDELRVALVVTTLHRGGAERIALDLHAHASKHGVASRLFVLDAPKRATYASPENTVEVYRVPKGKRIERMLERFSEEGIDVVHTHLLSAEWLSRMADEPFLTVQTLHNAEIGWPDGIQKLNVDLTIACSRGVEQDWKRSGKGPVRTIWNGISPLRDEARASRMEIRQALRHTRGISSRTNVLLSVANIRPQKNLEELPAILRGLLDRGVDATLVLVGEKVSASPPSDLAEQALLASIAREGVSERVIRVGSTDRVSDEYAAADVLVSSARHEGLSLVHLEALQAGLPIVVREAHGVSELRERHPDRVSVVGQGEGIYAMVQAISDCLDGACDPAAASPNPSRDGSLLSSEFSVHAMAEAHFRQVRALATSWRPTREQAIHGSSTGEQVGEIRVLFVTNNLVTGGAQSSLKRLVVELKRRGYSPALALLEEHPRHASHGRTEVESHGIPVKVLGPTGKRSRETMAMGLLETAAAMGVETVVFWNAIAPVKIAFAEIGFVFRIFDVSPGEMYFRSLETFFSRIQVGNIDGPARYGALLSGAIVKYERERDEAIRVLGTNVHVIPNGLPITDAQRTEADNAREGTFVIGTVCRISPDKRLEELIEGFRLLTLLLPDQRLELHMVGGPDRHQEVYFESLKQRAKDLPICWKGEILPATDALRDFDLFAMISEPAGCPNASLEAMAAGLAVVATDHGGASEQIIHGETGLLTSRGDPAELAKGLAILVKDALLRSRMGHAARARIESHFSIRRMVDAYIAVFGGSA